MAIELATAYVSLVAETTKLEAGVKQAFAGVGKQADAAGSDIGNRLAKTASKALKDGWRPEKDIMAGIPDTKLDRMGAHIGQVIGKGVVAGIKARQLGQDFGNSFASGAGSIGIGSIIKGWHSDLQGQSNKAGFLAGKALSAGLQAAAGAGIAGVTIALKTGFDRLVALDTSQYKLKQILKSSGKDAKEFDKIYAAIQKSVDKTPFSLDQAFGTAVQAIGAGAQDIERFMTDVSDAAGFAGTDLERMGLIFTQVLAKGKLTGEETMQLMEAGLPARSWIQQSYKLTAEQFDDMQQKGQITLDMLQKSIEDHAPGMAKALGNTLQGSIDNMQTALAKTGANFLSALFGGPTGDATEGLKSAVQRVTEMLNQLNQWIINHKEEIRDFFNSAKEVAGQLLEVLGNIASALKEHPGLIQAVVIAFAAWEGIKVISTVTTAITGLNAALGTTAGLASAAYAPLAAIAAIAAGGFIGGQALNNAINAVGPNSEAGKNMLNQATAPGMGIPGASRDPLFQPSQDLISGGGGPGAQRERRGAAPLPVAPPLIGAAGSPGQGYPIQWNGGSLSGSAGGAALNWKSIDSIASGRGLTMTSGYRDPNGPTLGGVPAWRSYHGSGRAHDYAGTPAQMAAFYSFMKSTYGSQLKELLHEDVGTSNEHVHVAFDTGGWLANGTQLVTNNTGKPELVLNPEQQQLLASQGIDPNALLNGSLPALNDPNATDQQSQSDMQSSNRTGGFIPVAAGNTGVAGTSALSSLFDMGNQVVGNLIDTGAQMASMAAAAGAGGAGGGGAGAGMAAQLGIQMGASIAKRGVKWGFDMLGIGTDALIAQLFPFGAPRWIGYDYTNFVPQTNINPAAVTTGEKAINAALKQPASGPGAGQNLFGGPTGIPPGPADALLADPGGPVQPDQLPGVQQPITQDPNQPPWMLGQFDAGGMLPPGGVGINLTKRPEPVLTPQQWDSLANIQPAGRDAPLVKIDAIYGMNPDDVAAQIEAKQRLAMMRYAGRP